MTVRLKLKNAAMENISEGGRIRGVSVTIGGSSYVPDLPNEADVKDRIQKITEENDDVINIAIKLCSWRRFYCNSGKRSS